MTTLQALVLPALMADEGFRSRPYRCSAGKWTIGYGTNLEDGIDAEEARFLLEYRTTHAIADCRKTWPWFAALDLVRQSVVVQMRYQLGLAGLLAFRRMLAALERSDYAGAADEMLESKWATHDAPARAHRLARLMRVGETA